MFEKLFTPMKIGNVEIPNRIVNEPMGTSYSNVNGECTPQEVAYYAERARGGVGLVITECMSVVPGGPTGLRGGGNPKQPNIGTDAAIEAGFNAGAIIREVVGCIDGRGGGKPAMAQAGGKNADGLDAALDAARAMLAK